MICSHLSPKELVSSGDYVQWCERCGAAWFDSEWHLPSREILRTFGGPRGSEARVGKLIQQAIPAPDVIKG